MGKAKELVHQLYNDLDDNSGQDMKEVKEVLLKVYKKLDRVKDEEPLINRLALFISFSAHANHLTFSSNQQRLITQLNEIGLRAKWNGGYLADHFDKTQFD